MTGGTIKGVLIASVAFIVLGITMNFVLPMFEGFDAARTDTIARTQIETDVGKTAGNLSTITLAEELFSADTSFITSVSSNNTADNASAVSSVTTTTATFSGMNSANDNRTLTVVYEYGTLRNFTSASTVIVFGPALILLGFIITVAVRGFLGISIFGKSDG